MKRRIAIALVLTSLAHNGTAAAQSARTIYRCDTVQGITFSDRPCGASSRPYEPDLSDVSVIDTVVPSAAVAKHTRAPVSRASRQVSVASPKSEVCSNLQQSLHKIASTMRAGYNARQGERLMQRKRELEEKRRLQKC